MYTTSTYSLCRQVAFFDTALSMLQHNESKNLLKTLSLSSSALPRESFFSFETYSAVWAKVTVTIGLARSIRLQNLQLPSHCFESAFCIAVIWYFDMAFCRPQSRNLLGSGDHGY